MITIDLQRIRETLPKRAEVTLGKTKSGSPFILCRVQFPSICPTRSKEEDEELAMIYQWQEDIIGKENISEFYSEDTGRLWYIYLKRVPMEFINLENKDLDTFTGLDISGNKKLDLIYLNSFPI